MGINLFGGGDGLRGRSPLLGLSVARPLVKKARILACRALKVYCNIIWFPKQDNLWVLFKVQRNVAQKKQFEEREMLTEGIQVERKVTQYLGYPEW